MFSFDLSTACQTLDGTQLDTLYDEGVVRYPSSRTTSRGGGSVREMALQTQSEDIVQPLQLPGTTSGASAEVGLQWDNLQGTVSTSIRLIASNIMKLYINKSRD